MDILLLAQSLLKKCYVLPALSPVYFIPRNVFSVAITRKEIGTRASSATDENDDE
jgi:hypothetical protein